MSPAHSAAAKPDDGGAAVVTVIVPGYDVADYAEEALASLRAQTLTSWVAVLVDDASTDATGALFDTAAASDERFVVVRHDHRRGLSAARNTGLDLVRTPFVGFLDADDRLTPHALSRLVDTLEDSGSDFAVGAYVRLRSDGEGRYTAGEVQPWVAAATDPARTRTTLQQHPAASGNIVAWSKVSRMDFWRRAGLRFPEGRLYEDQVVAQEMYTRAGAFDVIPDVVVEWRVRADGSSITQRTDALPVLREYLSALDQSLEVLETASQDAALRARVALILALDLPPLMRSALDHPDDGYRRALGEFVRQLRTRLPEVALPSDIFPALRW